MRSIANCDKVRWVLTLVSAMLCMGQNCANNTPSPPVSSACGQFAAECVSIIGTAPYGLASADLDNDNDIDLVVVNFGTANISVLLNQGDGLMMESARYSVTDWPDSIAIQDWSADGNLDLAVRGPLGLSLMTGRGDGTFTSAGELDIWRKAPQRLAIADMDDDHRLDLVVAGGGLVPDSVTIMHNDGQGHFADGPPVTVDDLLAGFSAIKVVDLNGDARFDLVLTNRYAGNVHTLIADGHGAYTVSSCEIAAKHILNDLLVEDLDGDNKLDFVVADNGNPLDTQDAGSVILLLDPLGAASSPIRFQAGAAPVALATADLNGDGRRDLIVANNMSDDVSILFNQGAGGFAAPASVRVGDGPTAIVAADLNSDGSPDLAVANMNSGTVSILFNDGTGHFTRGR